MVDVIFPQNGCLRLVDMVAYPVLPKYDNMNPNVNPKSITSIDIIRYY